jgi:N-acyl-D-aspartate/D-glutamate deacylase
LPALRKLAGQTRAALAARRDRAHQHAITDVVTDYARTEFINHSHGLVTDDEAALDRILAAENVQIGSADRRQHNANYRFADS